jgi:hypothetical protein
VATSALFPALPLPSIVRLNTGLKISASFHFVQMETIRTIGFSQGYCAAGETGMEKC